MFDIFCMAMGGLRGLRHTCVDGNFLKLPAHTQYTRWNDTHLDTIRRCVNRTRTEYVWVVSDLCDYSNFNFTWQPVPWEADQIHCWASGNQQFGDTFLVPVAAFKRQQARLRLLEWYEHINWHSKPYIPRFEWPTIDNLDELTTLYAWIKKTPANIDYEPCLWKKRDLHVFTHSGSVVLVPRDCKTHFKGQFYDYPYILRHTDYNIEEKPLDVVYLSNGEKNAERNWDLLKNLCPRAKRIDNITGRAQAYKACAEVSDTEWFFNVFAKCVVKENFNFNLQPDWLQGPKHWIFYSHNPVNGLEYGHMGIIIYHKQLVLNAETWGLDFTLSAKHGVIPIVGSIAEFNTDPFSTWRTAFRECVKLTQQDDVESRYRLKTWRTVAQGNHAKWSLRGANDAVKFVESGEDLQLSFEWSWLKNFFDNKWG